MESTVKASLFLLLVLGFCGVAQADESRKILECMRSNVPSSLRVQDIELTTTDRSAGSRSLRGKLYGLSETEGGIHHVSAMLHVYAPENLAGSAVLLREATQVREQGIYVYLPAVRRVRRVTGEFADGALLGSDFSYQDFKQLQNGFDGLDATLESRQVLEQRPVFVLSFKPLPGSLSSYSRIRSWVDQKTCVPLKVDFYQGQTLSKQLHVPVAAIKQSGNRWYAADIFIRDLRAGTGSQLHVVGVDSDVKLSRATFSPSFFYRGKY